jgi:hypothetical protein
MRTVYLNNSRSRWRNFNQDGSPEKHTWATASGGAVTRTVKYWENFGNFATATIKYNNKLISVFPDTILENEKTTSRNFK